eukprot:TRINITY_DN15637_c0_g1_i2.p1 TRINITY_DN15637_c0_g1~~TRINITY_DN15637_c0_g1_i2.p1  ORF type:complete len:168 (+),score=39.82 TRINITY_DN15637_c0_g1_i2:350-853(+)
MAGAPHVVLLYRRCLLHSFVSLKLALQNDVWYSTGAPNGQECRIVLDLHEFIAYCATERRRYLHLLQHLQHTPVLILEYSQLSGDALWGTVQRVEEFLGVQHDTALRTSCRLGEKQNPGAVQDRIVNWEETGLQGVYESGGLQVCIKSVQDHNLGEHPLQSGCEVDK